MSCTIQSSAYFNFGKVRNCMSFACFVYENSSFACLFSERKSFILILTFWTLRLWRQCVEESLFVFAHYEIDYFITISNILVMIQILLMYISDASICKKVFRPRKWIWKEQKNLDGWRQSFTFSPQILIDMATHSLTYYLNQPKKIWSTGLMGMDSYAMEL